MPSPKANKASIVLSQPPDCSEASPDRTVILRNDTAAAKRRDPLRLFKTENAKIPKRAQWAPVLASSDGRHSIFDGWAAPMFGQFADTRHVRRNSE